MYFRLATRYGSAVRIEGTHGGSGCCAENLPMQNGIKDRPGGSEQKGKQKDE